MQVAQGVMIVYALLTMVGGVMGLKAAGSKASLIAGLVSGVLLIIGCVVSRSSPQVGLGIAAVVALALGMFFALRLMKKGAKMPAVMMFPLSIISLIVFLWTMFAGGQNPAQP